MWFKVHSPNLVYLKSNHVMSCSALVQFFLCLFFLNITQAKAQTYLKVPNSLLVGRFHHGSNQSEEDPVLWNVAVLVS